MEKITYLIKIKEGMIEEYKRRHDELWPEIKESMRRQGIRNYTIWYYDDLDILFAYYEVPDSEEANRICEMDPVSKKWDEYMSDIISVITDEKTGEVKHLRQVFSFD